MKRHGLSVMLMLIIGTCFFLSQFPRISFGDDLDESDAALRENLLPAQQGDPQAQVFVGYLYETGQGGFQHDYSKAAQWYWKAAEQGNATAQFQLGNMYHLGKGIPQNYVMAYMWLDLAASGGNTGAKDIKRAVASKMSPSEIADAKRMAEEWRSRKK